LQIRSTRLGPHFATRPFSKLRCHMSQVSFYFRRRQSALCRAPPHHGQSRPKRKAFYAAGDPVPAGEFPAGSTARMVKDVNPRRGSGKKRKKFSRESARNRSSIVSGGPVARPEAYVGRDFPISAHYTDSVRRRGLKSRRIGEGYKLCSECKKNRACASLVGFSWRQIEGLDRPPGPRAKSIALRQRENFGAGGRAGRFFGRLW